VWVCDALPRNGEIRIATLRRTHDPVVQSATLAPDSDYEASGYAYCDELIARGNANAAALLRRNLDLLPGETLWHRFELDHRVGGSGRPSGSR